MTEDVRKECVEPRANYQRGCAHKKVKNYYIVHQQRILLEVVRLENEIENQEEF